MLNVKCLSSIFMKFSVSKIHFLGWKNKILKVWIHRWCTFSNLSWILFWVGLYYALDFVVKYLHFWKFVNNTSNSKDRPYFPTFANFCTRKSDLSSVPVCLSNQRTWHLIWKRKERAARSSARNKKDGKKLPLDEKFVVPFSAKCTLNVKNSDLPSVNFDLIFKKLHFWKKWLNNSNLLNCILSSMVSWKMV